jgi:hypothetical protein
VTRSKVVVVLGQPSKYRRCSLFAELALLLRLEARVVVVAREHPPENAQSRPAAPAVRVAVARDHAGRLLRLVHEGEDDVTDQE